MSIIANSFIGSLTCSSREFTHRHRVFIGFQLIESSSSSDFNSSHLIVTHRDSSHRGFHLIEFELISSHRDSSTHRDSSHRGFYLIESSSSSDFNSSHLIEFSRLIQTHLIVGFISSRLIELSISSHLISSSSC